MCVKGKISYSSPSNIAIIKYWGKMPGDQIPMNPSLSMTLDKCRSFTTIEYEVRRGMESDIEVVFEGKRSHEIEAKLQRWFTKISYFFSWLNYTSLRIESHNNFPYSAGIASSASGMSAVTMCLYAIDKHVNNTDNDDRFLQSNIARLGSGSASRSIQGPWVIWGSTEEYPEASDKHAVVYPYIHPRFNKLNDTIIVVDQEPKSISSRDGHLLMELHPFRSGRITQAKQNFKELLGALQQGNWNLFQQITEMEALSLHAMMLSSEGGLILWKGGSVEWMHYLRNARKKLGIPMAFTFDAGANIHLLYPESAKDDVLGLLESAPVPRLEFIHDHTGTGPEKLIDDYEFFK
jgi:diphosphomevalonate decarboxylase